MIIELDKKQEKIFTDISKKNNCSVHDVLNNLLEQYLDNLYDKELIAEAEVYQQLHGQEFTTHKEIMKEVYGEDID